MAAVFNYSDVTTPSIYPPKSKLPVKPYWVLPRKPAAKELQQGLGGPKFSTSTSSLRFLPHADKLNLSLEEVQVIRAPQFVTSGRKRKGGVVKRFDV